ncbi:MAG: HD domain-containing phosphohydrolase [Gemmatimonadales bacterium]|jgi:PAS domain S-box-containing protein
MFIDRLQHLWRHRFAAWYASTRREDARVALRMALSYLVFGVLWILVSDRVLLWLAPDPRLHAELQTVKGWAFVLFTAMFIFAVVHLAIRARRELRERTEESERFASTLVENLPGAVYACANDRLWTMIYLSPYIEELTGYRPAELLDNSRLSYASLIHAEDRERVWREVQTAVREQRGFRVEYRIHDRRGRVRRVSEQGCGVFTPAGDLKHLEGFITDISEREQAQQQVEQQLHRLRALRNIDLAIVGSLDLRIILDVLLGQVTSQLGVDAATVLTYDDRAEHLEFRAGRGFRTEALRHTRLHLGEGYAGRAARERETVQVADLRTTPGDLVWSWLAPEESFVSYLAIPLIAQGELRGVLELLHRSSLDPDESWFEFLEMLAGQAAIAIDNAALFDRLQRANHELRVAYDQTIEGWARALDLRDDETEGHSRRVTELALAIAGRLDVDPGELIHIRRGALLHDIGKLGVPDQILLKPGPLTDGEREAMERHPEYARDLLSSIPFLERALDIPYSHHERWDGTGYPRGLEGAEIPLAARIFAVADVYDALRSDRPYRDAWQVERAREYVRERAGSHFDPMVVEAFLSLEDEILDRVQKLAAMRQTVR